MVNIKSENGYSQVLDGIKIKTLVYGDNSLMSEFKMSAGSTLPSHSHPYEQTGYLVSGRIILHIGEEAHEMKSGYSWSVPADVMHFAEIIEDSTAIEVFSPAREDYKKYHS